MKTIKTKTVETFLLAALLLWLVVVVQAKTIAQEPDRPAQADENLQIAKVVEVQEHPEGRPFDYVNESSSLARIYDNYPYYDITLQLGDKRYVVRYENMGGYYPAAWRPGNEVKVRIEHGRAYILRYDGVLVNTPIVQTYS